MPKMLQKPEFFALLLSVLTIIGTGWGAYSVLTYKVDQQSKTNDRLWAAIENAKTEAKTDEGLQATSQIAVNKDVQDQLSEIKRSLGRVEGLLEGIKEILDEKRAK